MHATTERVEHANANEIDRAPTIRFVTRRFESGARERDSTALPTQHVRSKFLLSELKDYDARGPKPDAYALKPALRFEFGIDRSEDDSICVDGMDARRQAHTGMRAGSVLVLTVAEGRQLAGR